MINKFIKVTPTLYRGSAPDISDIKKLKDNHNINKIVSLDKYQGNKIDKVCKLLNIEHLIISIDDKVSSILNLKSYNIKDLLEDNPNIFVHCHAGKDRTGFLIAYYKIKYQNVPYKKALKEAEDLGFGVLVDEKFNKVIEAFKKILKSVESKDINDANVVSENYQDKKMFDTCQVNSFSPFMESHELMPNYQEEEIHLQPITHHISELPNSGEFDYNAGQPGIRSEFYGRI